MNESLFNNNIIVIVHVMGKIIQFHGWGVAAVVEGT